jgi:hypothetical protein
MNTLMYTYLDSVSYSSTSKTCGCNFLVASRRCYSARLVASRLVDDQMQQAIQEAIALNPQHYSTDCNGGRVW